MNLYQNKYSNPTYSAQQDLMGRTHYVDPDTLRFHKSRILEYNTHCNGLLASVIESCSLDMRNTRRECDDMHKMVNDVEAKTK